MEKNKDFWSEENVLARLQEGVEWAKNYAAGEETVISFFPDEDGGFHEPVASYVGESYEDVILRESREGKIFVELFDEDDIMNSPINPD